MPSLVLAAEKRRVPMRADDSAFHDPDGVGANKENTWPAGQENGRLLLTSCASSEQLYSHTLSDYSEKRPPKVWMATKRKAAESDECFADLHGAAHIAARTEGLEADMRPRSILKPVPPPEELEELPSERPGKRRRKKDSCGIGGTGVDRWGDTIDEKKWKKMKKQAGTLIKPLSPQSKQEWEKNLAQVFGEAYVRECQQAEALRAASCENAVRLANTSGGPEGGKDPTAKSTAIGERATHVDAKGEAPEEDPTHTPESQKSWTCHAPVLEHHPLCPGLSAPETSAQWLSQCSAQPRERPISAEKSLRGDQVDEIENTWMDDSILAQIDVLERVQESAGCEKGLDVTPMVRRAWSPPMQSVADVTVSDFQGECVVLDSAGKDSLHGRKPQEKVVDGQDRSRDQKTEECVHDALTNDTRRVLQVNQKTELNQEDRCRCGSGKAFLECHGLYLCNYLCGFAGAYDVVAKHESTCSLRPHVESVGSGQQYKDKGACMEQESRLCGMLPKIPDVSTTMHMQTAPHTKKPEEATIGSPCRAPPRPVVGAGAGAMEGKELNDEQFRAVRHPAGEPLMILAGAGSGKTKTLISRIQFLHSEGIALHRILVLTFSTAATKELSERVKKAFPRAKKEMDQTITISTFHSFALKVCRKFADALGLHEDFVLFSGGRQRKVVTAGLELFKQSKSQGGEVARAGGGNMQVEKNLVKRVCQALTRAFADGTVVENMVEELAFVYKYYKATLLECKSLDMANIVGEASRLLREHPPAIAMYGSLFDHVLVDEFQDTSKSQLMLVTALAPRAAITVVGDDDQTIFGFNGSNHKNFDLFRAQYPHVRELRLLNNYRSSGVIVEASRALIQHNKMRAAKMQKPVAPPGLKIQVIECRNETCEVRFVVENIKAKVAAGTSYKDLAVLYRTQKTGRLFQEQMRKEKLPFNVHGVSFWRRKVVKTFVGVLRLTTNTGDDQAFRRVLKAFIHHDKESATTILAHLEKVARSRKSSLWLQGKVCLDAKVSGAFSKQNLALGKRFIKTLEGWMHLATLCPTLCGFADTILSLLPEAHKYEMSVSQEEGSVLLNQGKDSRTIRQVIMESIRSFEESWRDADAESGTLGGRSRPGKMSGCARVMAAFLDFQLIEEAECNRQIKADNENSVTISTIHHSKGLEWEHVYIVRCVSGEMPLSNNVHAPINGLALEEERRLCYVAMTRARSTLHMTYVLTLQKQMATPSPFLAEIPQHLLERTSVNAVMDFADESESSFMEQEEQATDSFFSCGFLSRFDVSQRGSVSRLFHKYAKTASCKQAGALIGKIKGVVHEKLAARATKQNSWLKLLLNMLLEPTSPGESSVASATALQYAHEVIAFEAQPQYVREQHKAARTRHFAQSNALAGMENKLPTAKQLAFLKSLGCPLQPKSMMECSALIDKYKKM